MPRTERKKRFPKTENVSRRTIDSRRHRAKLRLAAEMASRRATEHDNPYVRLYREEKDRLRAKEAPVLAYVRSMLEAMDAEEAPAKAKRSARGKKAMADFHAKRSPTHRPERSLEK